MLSKRVWIILAVIAVIILIISLFILHKTGNLPFASSELSEETVNFGNIGDNANAFEKVKTNPFEGATDE